MPEGFAFPINHRMWVPLPLRPSGYAPLEGAPVRIFGRIAKGATQKHANDEVAAITDRVRAASPRTHEHLRPRVLPYAFAYTDMGDPENFLAMRAIQLALLLLLVIVCVNVAILVYARTATRQGEIAVRAALGASRPAGPEPSAGELPAVRVGRSFRVSEPDVDAYLASRYTQAG